MTIYVLLEDVTPNRGTVARLATEDEATHRNVFRWTGAEAPRIGDRAWCSDGLTAVASDEVPR